jgi:sporulation protein YlmC with PRC-barrel domain
MPETVVSADPRHDLISSTRVEGTVVYDRRAEKIGKVHSVMFDKRAGQIAYAVLSFGGFLGFASRVYPIPWQMLTYDPKLHGYMVDLTREQVEAAPFMELDNADRPRETAEPVYRHWDEYF